MPKFSYIALDTAGKSHNGDIEATDQLSVANMLAGKGLRPLSVSEAGKTKKGDIPLPKFLQSNKIKSEDLVMFTRQLSAMVSAGVPLLRSLGSLEQHNDSAAAKRIIGEIFKDVQSGNALGDALAKHPESFSDVYVNMVRAGEAAGILDDILKRLAIQQEKSESIKKKVKSAMTYPMVLVFITVAVFFVLMIFVIPQIGAVIGDLSGGTASLPTLTVVMLGISSFIISSWYILIPVIVGAVYALMRYLKTKRGRSQFHRFVLKVPKINAIVQKVAVARFARTFSALIGAGVAVLEALEVTAHAVGNSVYEEILIDATDQVKNGATLSKIIEKAPEFPPIVAQMLAVGEETGQTDQVLVKVADFYEEEVDVAIGSLSSIIEPVMIVFMGGMVGLIAASVMMPIAGLAQSVK